MPPRRRKRLDPALFNLPVERMRQGDYSDESAAHTRDVLRADGASPRVTMQISARAGGLLGGMDEAIAILKLCADDWNALVVHALYDGDRIQPWETVMSIEGGYDSFAHLENLCLGVLSRRTRVGTNTRTLVEAARPKSIMFFPAQHDHWLVQPGDGYAAHIAGALRVTTDAQAKWGGSSGLATVPHGLIAAYRGDTATAARKFSGHLGEGVRLIALVDYENDCVRTSLEVARALDDRLWGVRLDTSPYLVDRSILPQMGSFDPTGVNPQLVWAVRNALDAEGFGDVKIAVSGDFTVERIRAYEDDGVPVDAYGVGASIFAGRYDFVADIVCVGTEPQIRAGREARPNPRMERVK